MGQSASAEDGVLIDRVNRVRPDVSDLDSEIGGDIHERFVPEQATHPARNDHAGCADGCPDLAPMMISTESKESPAYVSLNRRSRESGSPAVASVLSVPAFPPRTTYG
jgi:hypothetical protein